MKTLYLSLLALLFHTLLQAQSETPSIFSLANKPQTAAPSSEQVDTAHYNRALRVYNRLVQGRGDTRMSAPKFVMSREERYMAWMDFGKMEVGLEEKAFEVASGYGMDTDAVLATLLAQALTHYYEQHAAIQAFAADSKIAVQNPPANDVTYEAKANYLGGFLAYSAGYGFFDKSPELLSHLYKAYNLPEQLEGFPSLSERVKLSQHSMEKVRKLVELFDMGNLLAVLKKFEDSRQYYEYVLHEYQSREIYNNAGVSALLDAVAHFGPNDKEVKFHFPVELDLATGAAERGGNDRQDARNLLLQKAIQHFDDAIHLSPKYAPAYLNKACAYALLGDVQRAQFYAEVEAQQMASQPGYEKTAKDLQVFLGILQAWRGETEKAKAAFQTASNEGSNVAAYNLVVLEGGDPTPKDSNASGLPPKTETIDGIDLSELSEIPEWESDSEVSVGSEIKFYHNLNPGANSRFYVTINEVESQAYYFLLTGPGYNGKTAQKLSVGALRAEVEKAYPAMERALETPNGEIRVYPSIILMLGLDGRLTRWVTYGERHF